MVCMKRIKGYRFLLAIDYWRQFSTFSRLYFSFQALSAL
jgi:hypothetical protein